ncbi:MAG: polysaccharide deacetylase family protein [Polaribacter sp.]
MKEKDNIANFLWDEAKIGQLDVFLENEKPYLSSQQVKELIKGGFDIGSHSKTHPVFSRLDYINFENEILESINFLEKKFKYKIKSFSYPFGEKADVSFENSFCIKNKRDLIFLGINNNLENYNLNRLERDNLEFKFNMMMFRFTLLPIFRKLITNLKIK